MLRSLVGSEMCIRDSNNDKANGDEEDDFRVNSEICPHRAMLGLRARGALSAREIHAAFRATALFYHPDRRPGVSASELELLQSQFVVAKAARDTLLEAIVGDGGNEPGSYSV